MWNWIKKLFRPWNLKKQTITPDYDKMTKGDLKKANKTIWKNFLLRTKNVFVHFRNKYMHLVHFAIL